MWVVWILTVWSLVGCLGGYLMGKSVGEWRVRRVMFKHGLVRLDYSATYDESVGHGYITHANLVCACGWVSDDSVDPVRQFNDHIELYTNKTEYQILVQDSEGRFTNEIGRI